MQKHLMEKQNHHLKKIKSEVQQSSEKRIEFGFFRFHTQVDDISSFAGNSRR
jgi:hypothetical protein